MMINVSILSFSVLKNVISIRLTSSSNNSETIQEIKQLKGCLQKYIIEGLPARNGSSSNKDTKKLDLSAKIQSLNIRSTLNFVLHTEKQNFQINEILDMMNRKLIIKFMSRKEKKLQELLNKVAEVLNLPETEVLYKFTTFKSKKNGKTVIGKRSIYELSEKHKTVVIDKLRRMLDSSRAL